MSNMYRKPPASRGLKIKPALEKRLDNLLQQFEGELCAESDILNLPGWRSIGYKESNHDISIFAIPLTLPEQCQCGLPASALHQWGYTDTSFIQDTPIRGKRVRIYYAAQRYRCTKGCSNTLQQPLPGVDEHTNVTKRHLEYIERLSFKINYNFSMISSETGVNEQIVRNIFTKRARTLEKNWVIQTPQWLAIDGVYIAKKERCVISDPVNSRVVNILHNNDKDVLKKFLLQIPNRKEIIVVSIDMSSTYREAVRHLLPQADIVADRFHVQDMANRALKAVLKHLRETRRPSWLRDNMRDPSLLLKRAHDLSDEKESEDEDSQKETVKKWRERVPEVDDAYRLKEEFCNIFEMPEREAAERRFEKWAEKAQQTSPAFDSVINNVKKWHEEVFSYITFRDRFSKRVSNAFAESVNNNIKRVQRSGHGYNYWTLRAKMVYGGGFVEKRPAHPFDIKSGRTNTKKTGLKRSKYTEPDLTSNSNTAELKRSAEEQDKTRGLIPSPRGNAGFDARLGHICPHKKKQPRKESEAKEFGQMSLFLTA